LWDLVLLSYWDRVVEHAAEHPQDAEWVDGHYHETVLYLACQNNPPLSAIRAILRAHPGAAVIQNSREHDLPIHIACRFQLDAGILGELVRDHPGTAAQQTRWGRTPLVNLWNFRQKEDDSGTSAVPMRDDAQFWNKVVLLLAAVARYREDPTYLNQRRLGGEAFRSDPTGDPTSAADTRTPNETLSQDDSLLPESTDSASPRVNGDNYHLVHAAVSLGALSCPLGALEHVLRLHPDQVFARDAHGQLPLHVAVGPSPWNGSTRRKYRPREKEFLAALLRIHPRAAGERVGDGTITNHGRHPLHMALVNRHLWSGGVEELFRAAPDVVLRIDPPTSLYPFQLAAIPSGDTTVDLETIYQLLRSRPEVLNRFCLKREGGPSERSKEGEQYSGGGVPRKGTKSSSEGGSPCPPFLHDVLLGTATALFIGGFAGRIFAD
jgi:hypothetical protein